MVISQIGLLGSFLENKMLIELIGTHEIDFSSENVVAVIENIFCAFREGKHAVMSDKKTLEAIVKNENFSVLTRNTAQAAIHYQNEMRALLNIINFHCKVDFSDENINKQRIDLNSSFFKVSYLFFRDSLSLQNTKLICEDIDDFSLYKIITDMYKFDAKASNLNVSFEVCHGGGGNMRKNFNMHSQKNYFSIYLLDSDKKHPRASFGSTAGNFNDAEFFGNNKFIIIEANEIEALIPTKIIFQAIADKYMDNKYIKSAEELESLIAYNPTVKTYLDHKEGITIKKAQDLDLRYKDNFWTSVFTQAPNFRRKGCLTKFECSCKTPCKAAQGFGNGLLDAATKTMERMSLAKIKDAVDNNLLPEWQLIGKSLFSWGCAYSKRVRTS